MTHDFLASANAGIQALKPYEPGKPIDELERELGITDIIKLASNESPLGPSPKGLRAAQEALLDLHRYPDGSGHRLKAALAKKLGVNSKQVTLGNGSNDVLDLIVRCWLSPGDELIFSQYGFAVYPIAALSCNAKPVVVPAKNYGHDLDAMLAAITENTRIICIANPNNPTGTWLSAEAIDSFLAQVPKHILVVLDEAYFEYVEESDYPDGLARLPKYPNVIVARTFSKMYGLSGLRVGYAVSSLEIAEVLNRVRQPFNCNSIALAAAEAALEDHEYLAESLRINREGLQQVNAGLAELGLETIPSVTNFVAFDCGQPAAGVFEALLAEGVITRPLAGYQMPNHLRVSIGLPEENQRFLAALKKVLA